MANEREPSSAAKLVDAINALFGKQGRNRAIHAKGIVATGRFTPSAAAGELSRAPHFAGSPTNVLVRFSNFSGDPRTRDDHVMASPRGMALRFRLHDGSDTDLVTHSYDGFPVATTDDFRALLLALAASPADARRPTAAERFMREHPAARAFLEAPHPLPVSYATLRYFGVNSFRFINAAGRTRYGRYRLEPSGGEQVLPKGSAPGGDYLGEELRARVHDGPIGYVLRVQLAAEGDRIEDPSIPWPASRATIDVGSLAIDRVVGSGEAIEGPLLFSPAMLPPGIEAADPMLAARDAAYPVSYTRRH